MAMTTTATASRRAPDGDAVAAARALATNRLLATRFVRARAANDAGTATALVANAVEVVVASASQAKTTSGRRRKLERSAVVFTRVAAEGLSESPQLGVLGASDYGHDDVAVLASWCEAVYLGLRGVLRHG